MEVAGVGKIGGGRAVVVSEELGDLSGAIGAVVEEEEGIAACGEGRQLIRLFFCAGYTRLELAVHAPPR